MRSTSSGSGSPATFGSASGPAWWAPTLSPYSGSCERVHLVRVPAGLERDDRGNRPLAVGPEVAERLAGRLDRQRLVEQLVHPWAGGDDDRVGVDLVRVSARVLADVELARERGERLVGAGDAGLRLHDDERAFGHADRVAPLGFLALESLPGNPAALERVGGALLQGLHDLDEAGKLEHRLAALGFELAPERERLLGEADVVVFRVGEPEDPRAAVARAAIVTDRELLVDDGLVAAALERPGRREAHHARRR